MDTKVLLLVLLAIFVHASAARTRAYSPPRKIRDMKNYPLDHFERIVGGTDCSNAEADHLVNFNIVYSNNRRAACTGTRIAESTFLTAAHCVITMKGTVIKPESSTALYASTTAQPTSSTVRQITEVWIPSNYNRTSFLNDIAVVKTDSDEGSNNKEVLIYGTNAIIEDNKAYTIAGYGQEIAFGVFPEECQKRAVFIRDIDDCIAVAKGLIPQSDDGFFDEDTQLCTISDGLVGVDAGGSSPCVGDDGGPLMENFGNNNNAGTASDRPIIIGIFSYNAFQCGNAGYPSFYTNVKEYDDDIQDIVDGNIPDGWVLLVNTNTR